MSTKVSQPHGRNGAGDGRVIVGSPLCHLDPSTVSQDARKESRNREIYLPPVSTFRWWARRTGAVKGGLIAAFENGRSERMVVADPFAGGGIVPLEAAIRGHRVYAQDVNPWAVHGLATMLGLPSPEALRAGQEAVHEVLKDMLKKAYATKLQTGDVPAQITQTFRVATAECPKCEERMRLFPYAMVSLHKRKDLGGTDCILACHCGHLFEGHSERGGTCPECKEDVDPEARYTRGRVATCPTCRTSSTLNELAEAGDWDWQVVLVERAGGGEREMGLPTEAEIEQAESSDWQPKRALGPIPDGQETKVLLRHGFSCWEDLYPRRQRVVLEVLLSTINKECEPPVRDALRLAALGTIEMAGHLSRWDRWYLKSYEGMANHRFNFTTFTAEPNVWGCEECGRGVFIRRVRQLAKASAWIRERTEHNEAFEVEGPLPAGHRRTRVRQSVDVRVVEGSSERIVLQRDSIDLVLTDPPYHDDVQYGELSLPFRAWAEQSMAFLADEAVVNGSSDKNGGKSYRKLLSRIFKEVGRALKTDGHLVFSYANRDPDAWVDVFWALQEAGLQAAGYEVLHSENETDLAKRDVRACTMDFIMDLVPADVEVDAPWEPEEPLEGEEGAFLQHVGRFFLQIGRLEGNWEEELREALLESAFLAK